MHRWIAASLGFLLPFLAGCPYCAYPRLDCTPPVRLDAATPDVHVFRVDQATNSTVSLGGFISGKMDLFSTWDHVTSHQLTKLSTQPTDTVPMQVKPSLSYGLAYPLLVANGLSHSSHTVAVRIYRPGFELVEIASWQAPPDVRCKRVDDVFGQAHALDRLYSWPLEPGSASEAHREALLFGATEYERLAGLETTTDFRFHLTVKAGHLREQAAK